MELETEIQQKSTMSMVFRIIVSVVLGFVVVLLFGVFQFFTSQTGPGGAQVSVDALSTVDSITNDLTDSGGLKSPWLFQRTVYVLGLERSFQAGVYDIPEGTNLLGVVYLLTGKEGVPNEYQFTIVEGQSLNQIADAYAEYYVSVDDVLATESAKSEARANFLAAANDISAFQADYEFLSDLDSSDTLEGFLFPDTYRLLVKSEPDVVIRKMLDNFDVKFDSESRLEAKAQGRSVQDVVIFASIVQLEVGNDADMKKVAGVFQNRLNIGKELESDATVNYVTGKNDPQPTFNDVAINSPYNTYENVGLPPGPISNPGFAALQAALYPEEHDYFFFLTTLDTGELILSKTGEEHLANKRKFLD